jgi:hypothetical protein
MQLKATKQTIKTPAFDELSFFDELNGSLISAIAIVGCAADAAMHRDDNGMAETILAAQTIVTNAKGLLDEWDRKARVPRAEADRAARIGAQMDPVSVEPMSPEAIERLQILINRDKRLNKAAAKAKAKGGKKK